MKKRDTFPITMRPSRRLMPGQALYRAATVCLLLGIAVSLVCDVWGLEFPLSTPCYLDRRLHLYCPGCGGTRALFALMRLDFVDSVLSNPFVVYMAGLFLYYYIGTTLAVLAKGRKIYFHPGFWMLWITIALLVWTTFGRNYLAVRYGIDYLGDIAVWWSQSTK